MELRHSSSFVRQTVLVLTLLLLQIRLEGRGDGIKLHIVYDEFGYVDDLRGFVSLSEQMYILSVDG